MIRRLGLILLAAVILAVLSITEPSAGDRWHCQWEPSATPTGHELIAYPPGHPVNHAGTPAPCP